MIEALVGDPGAQPGDDAEGIVDRRIKPSLLTLLTDQAALLDPDAIARPDEHALREGFPDRRGVIMWYQRAVVRTVGHIADDWEPIDCLSDATLLSALCYDPQIDMEIMPPGDAKKYRAVLEAEMVQPACNRAYRDLRDVASDYIADKNEGEGASPTRDLTPTGQRNVAMRPGFQTMDEQQRQALDALWGGFEDVNELLDWLHGLNSPTNGEIAPDIAQATISDDTALRYLIDESDAEEARIYREAFATMEILPAFVAGIRSMDTGELAATESSGSTTFRMKGGQ